MKFVSALAIFFIGLAMTLLPSVSVSAQTPTVSDCQVLIAQTEADLATVTIGGGHPEQTRISLQSKLTDASTKLDEGKFQDALAKLIAFRTSIEQFVNAPKPKISQEDATLLISDVNAAISCVQALIEG